MADNMAAGVRGNPMSLTALAVAIVGTLVYWVGGLMYDLWPIGLAILVVSLVMGIIARRREPAGKTLAMAAIVISAVSIVWFAVWLVLVQTGVITDTS